MDHQSSSKSFDLEEQNLARTVHFQKPAVLEQEKKWVRLLRPWRDTNHFSKLKTVF